MAFPATIEQPKFNWLPWERPIGHAAHHNTMAILLKAIQEKIWVDGSANTSTIDYILSHHNHDSIYYTETEIDTFFWDFTSSVNNSFVYKTNVDETILWKKTFANPINRKVYPINDIPWWDTAIINLWRFTALQWGARLKLVINVSNWFNANNDEDTTIIFDFKTSNWSSVDANWFAWNAKWYRFWLNWNAFWFKVVSNVWWGWATYYDIYGFFVGIYLWLSSYEAFYGSWTWVHSGVSNNVNPWAASSTVCIATEILWIYSPIKIASGSPWAGKVLTSDNQGNASWQWVPWAWVPTWGITLWSTASAPAWYLLCNGSAVSRTTYATLFLVLGTTYGAGDGSTTFNVPSLGGRIPIGIQTAQSKGNPTITIASPGVITLTAHWLADGNKVYFTTTGALPTGITPSTEYFVVNATANTFSIATTFGGTAINTSGTQSWTHTVFFAGFNSLWETWGEVSHKLSIWEMPSHNHSVTHGWYTAEADSLFKRSTTNTGSSTGYTNSTGWDAYHNIMSPYIVLNYIIKT